jgi:integrase
LKKYGYNLKLLSNQKLNDALHDLFKELEFDAPTTVYEKRGANTTAVVKPLYKVLAFHSARRFFISYLVNSKKISIGNIMAWSNHKNINVVKKYIKQGMEQEEQMRELFG